MTYLDGYANGYGSTTTSYLDTGLDPETEYFYRVIAFNDAGESDPSVVVSATTSGWIADLLDLLEATGDDEDRRLADRLRAANGLP